MNVTARRYKNKLKQKGGTASRKKAVLLENMAGKDLDCVSSCQTGSDKRNNHRERKREGVKQKGNPSVEGSKVRGRRGESLIDMGRRTRGTD